MEARLVHAALVWAALVSSAFGAGFRTQNFVVNAATPELAREVCMAAEHYRKTLAVAWLGAELPAWQDRCPISVVAAPNLGAGGVTSFVFHGNRPRSWQMKIQGSRERILDSVLPHEVTHTIFATHFGRPLPRWADEGACTTVEHVSEKNKHDQHLYRYLVTNRGIPFNHMFRMTEYPEDIMPLYAQGHSVVEFLLQHADRRRFVDFVGDGMRTNHWDRCVRDWYGFQDLSDLQIRWVDWLRKGRPPVGSSAPPTQLAVLPATDSQATAVNATPAVAATPIVRAQNDSPTTLGSWYARQRSRAQQAIASSVEPAERSFTPGSTRAAVDLRTATRPAETTNTVPPTVNPGEEGHWSSASPRR